MVLAFTTSLCGGIGGEGVPGLFGEIRAETNVCPHCWARIASTEVPRAGHQPVGRVLWLVGLLTAAVVYMGC